MSDLRVAAHRFVGGSMSAPGRYGEASLMATTVHSGLAASINNGRVHVVNSAAIATDGDKAVLVVRWVCGGGSINARPAAADEVACDWCERLGHLPEGPVVYRCYDDEDRLLYIGSSVNMRQRVRNHRTTTRWWGDVARLEAEPVESETAARLSEALAITAELPERNRFGIPLRVLNGGQGA